MCPSISERVPDEPRTDTDPTMRLLHQQHRQKRLDLAVAENVCDTDYAAVDKRDDASRPLRSQRSPGSLGVVCVAPALRREQRQHAREVRAIEPNN